MNSNINAYSSLKIFHHPEKVNDILNNKRTSPIYIRIKPTNVCNQKCYYCIYSEDDVIENRQMDKRAFIPWEKMQEIIEDISDMGVKAVTFSGGGEPLCYKYMLPTIKLIKQKKIDFSVITNGQALEGEIAELLVDAKWIRISLDSSNSETYKSIRGVPTFDKVIDNIKNFAKIKKGTCTLGINYVITKDNYDQIYDICKILHNTGVDNIKFSPLRVKEDMIGYHNKIKEEVIGQINNAIKDFKTEKFSIVDKYESEIDINTDYKLDCKECYMKEVFTVIAADSKVYFCHQRAYTKDGEVGDISNTSFKKLWFSEETTNRFKNMNAIEECDCRCVFKERNKLLDDFIKIDKNHINFV